VGTRGDRARPGTHTRIMAGILIPNRTLRNRFCSEFIRAAKADGVPLEVEKLVQRKIGVARN